MPDHWIVAQAEQHHMIEPFVGKQKWEGIISYGASSYGYDARCAPEFKVFTNVNNAIVDPKDFSAKCFVEINDDACVIPPNSFVLAMVQATICVCLYNGWVCVRNYKPVVYAFVTEKIYSWHTGFKPLVISGLRIAVRNIFLSLLLAMFMGYSAFSHNQYSTRPVICIFCRVLYSTIFTPIHMDGTDSPYGVVLHKDTFI